MLLSCRIFCRKGVLSSGPGQGSKVPHIALDLQNMCASFFFTGAPARRRTAPIFESTEYTVKSVVNLHLESRWERETVPRDYSRGGGGWKKARHGSIRVHKTGDIGSVIHTSTWSSNPRHDQFQAICNGSTSVGREQGDSIRTSHHTHTLPPLVIGRQVVSQASLVPCLPHLCACI